MPLITQFWNQLKGLPDLGKFVLTGLTATLVHYIALRLLLLASLPLAAANIIGFITALFISYYGNRYFVFEAKYNHLKSFTGLATGAIIAAGLHTTLLVGLTDGSILSFLNGPAYNWGGSFFIAIWEFILHITPEFLRSLLIQKNIFQFTTGFAFIVACGSATLITYFWNKYLIFKPQS